MADWKVDRMGGELVELMVAHSVSKWVRRKVDYLAVLMAGLWEVKWVAVSEPTRVEMWALRSVVL